MIDLFSKLTEKKGNGKINDEHSLSGLCVESKATHVDRESGNYINSTVPCKCYN